MAAPQPGSSSNKGIDKVTFFEYCNLPGILQDRFYRMFSEKDDSLISEQQFVSIMLKVFMSDFD
eukprot:CAMPEP_0202961652 /NCGR_PEP_ID=MMETSP1396-20130829/5718_1 /ASSEMBLY_ACC=CAM_ASM_000872 /TAXON_ID= /ORGANISM="Pseudokeronopsis sp., Strain Brazil" /LENGTH=63 /DNA_ID=CAMNT_0049681647 /DNA_START=157 /DNA_END=348 /DNA_ORIENTATION=+